MAQSELSLEAFSKVVEAIDDCAFEPGRWRDALRLIADITASDRLNLAFGRQEQIREDTAGGAVTIRSAAHAPLAPHGRTCESRSSASDRLPKDISLVKDRTPKIGTSRIVRAFEYGFDEGRLQLYLDEHAGNKLMAAAHLKPVDEIFTVPSLVDEREHLESRFYREWCKPQNLRHYMGVNVLKTTQHCACLSINRTERQPRFGRADLRLLRLLAPHLRRALRVSDALDFGATASQVLEATLDALVSGVFLVDGEGRLVYMNRAGEDLIRAGVALRIVDGRLSPASPGSRSSMTSAIAAAGAGTSVALPAGNTTGLIASILPLDRGKRQDLSKPFAATIAIFVQHPTAAPILPGEAFAKLYRLTGSELRVLLALAPGLSVKAAADILGISEATAKTHLQRIFSKTNTSKQTELMHLLRSSTPPIKAA